MVGETGIRHGGGHICELHTELQRSGNQESRRIKVKRSGTQRRTRRSKRISGQHSRTRHHRIQRIATNGNSDETTTASLKLQQKLSFKDFHQEFNIRYAEYFRFVRHSSSILVIENYIPLFVDLDNVFKFRVYDYVGSFNESDTKLPFQSYVSLSKQIEMTASGQIGRQVECV